MKEAHVVYAHEEHKKLSAASMLNLTSDIIEPAEDQTVFLALSSVLQRRRRKWGSPVLSNTPII